MQKRNSTNVMADPLLTAEEVAKFLKIECRNPKRSVDRLRRQGLLTGVNVAGRWRYRIGDVNAYLSKCN